MQYLIISFAVMYSAHGMVVPVYTQENRSDTFLGAEDLPTFTQFTVGMWFYGKPDISSNFIGRSIINLYGDKSDALKIDFYIEGLKLRITRNSTKIVVGKLPLKAGDIDRLKGWNYHCWSWKFDSEFRWYISGSAENDRSVTLWKSEPLRSDVTVTGGCSITILQEQDDTLGRFNIEETLPGRVALFNMWDRELSLSEIQRIECLTEGNILAMSHLLIGGPANLTQQEVPCDEELTPVFPNKGAAKSISEFTLMIIERGVALNTNTSVTVTKTQKMECLLMCLNNPFCVSVNYVRSSGRCEMNDVTSCDLDVGAGDYVTDLDTDHLHFTRQAFPHC